MTQPGIRVNVGYSVDVSDAQRALTQLEHNLSFGSMSGFLYRTAAPWLQARAQARFAAEGDELTGRWSPLRKATLIIRAKHGFPTSPINVRTGQMKAFVTGSFGDVSMRGDETMLTWPRESFGGVLERKLMTAQRGRKSPNTTDRPVIAVGEADSIHLTAELTAHLMTGM